MLINGEGINLESLVSQLQSIGENGVKEKDSSDSDFSKILEEFDSIDADGNGEISKEELSTMEKFDFANLISDDLLANFDNYDKDNNGEFSQSEFKAALELEGETKQEELSKNGFSDLLKSLSESNILGDDLKNKLGNLASTFINKLLSSYH